MDKKIVTKKCIDQSYLSSPACAVKEDSSLDSPLPPLAPAVLFFRIFEVASTATGIASLVIK